MKSFEDYFGTGGEPVRLFFAPGRVISPIARKISGRTTPREDVNCGIMDQFSVGMGKADHAVLLRCKTLEYRYVPLTLGDYQLVIINSNKRRELTESKYNERRLECEAGFALIQKYLPHATDLGSVRPEEWERVKCAVPVETIRKRLEHVVNENERVLQSTKALEAGNLQGFGQYMFESHESLRDLYEVTGAELDVLFEEARRVEGCINENDGGNLSTAGYSCISEANRTDS